MMGTIKMTLNIIITPIIITHAQGFECITKFFGEGYLAAPYFSPVAMNACVDVSTIDRNPKKRHALHCSIGTLQVAASGKIVSFQ